MPTFTAESFCIKIRSVSTPNLSTLSIEITEIEYNIQLFQYKCSASNKRTSAQLEYKKNKSHASTFMDFTNHFEPKKNGINPNINATIFKMFCIKMMTRIHYVLMVMV